MKKYLPTATLIQPQMIEICRRPVVRYYAMFLREKIDFAVGLDGAGESLVSHPDCVPAGCARSFVPPPSSAFGVHWFCRGVTSRVGTLESSPTAKSIFFFHVGTWRSTGRPVYDKFRSFAVV